jgi:apolipoprotein N-acyltransferase
MKNNFHLFSSFSLCVFEVNAHLSSVSDDFYTAAVVEFSLPTTPNIAVAKPKRMIENSLNEYLRLINEAKDDGKADIIVFPEGSLNYFGIQSRKKLIKYAVELNETDIYNSTTFDNVCDYSDKSSVSEKGKCET